MERFERSDSLINNRQGAGHTAVMPDLGDSHKENEEKTASRDRVNGFKEQPKRSHRKSASPSHIGDSHKVAKMAQGPHRREPDVKFVGDTEHAEKNETDVVNKVRGVTRDEDLLTFAEILYKCSLCTTLPSILTSQGAFLRHVKEHHVAKQTAGDQCPHCYLHFQTHTDLQAHLTDAHSGPELDNAAALSGVSSRTSPQLTELERPTSPRPPDCGDGGDKREVEEKKHTDDQSDGDDLTRPTKGQNKQISVEDSGEVDVKPQISGLRPSSSTPQATLQYHSSAHSPHTLHVLSAVSPLSPPHHPQQVDPRHSPLWGGGCPQETFNGFPNFTPEFGRYTKLIREGGRIVYFCQVCNVKCQVKAAFQVHCNGVRHHNTVNMVGKNKGHVTPPHAAREACLRSPLKEVPVMAPQLTALRPDHSLAEKMNKFFRDHPDMSAILNHGGGQAAGDVWGFPVNFSLKDQPGGQSDSEESTKQSETDGRCSEKRHPHFKESCMEKVRTSPVYPPGSSLKRESDEQCVVNCRQRLEHDNSSVWTVSNHCDSGACDLTCEKGRKRPAPSTPVTESLTVSDNSSASLTRTSSTSPAKCEGKITHQDSGDAKLTIPCCDSSSGPSANKRARLDTPHGRSGHEEPWEPSAPRCRDVPLVTNGDLDGTQSTASCPDRPHEQRAGSPRHPDKGVGEVTHHHHHHHPDQREERRWSEPDQDKENLSDVDSVDGTRPSDDHSPSGGDTSLHHPVSALHTRQQSRSKSDNSSDVGTGSEQARESRVLESAATHESGTDSSTSLQNKHGLADQERRTAPGAAEVTVKRQHCGADSPSSLTSQCTLSPAPDHSVLGMLVKQSFTLDRGPCFFPGVVLDDWGRPDMAKDSDRPLWAAAAGLALHEADDVTDSGKGQSNSEGWKVTKIRDVLRGLIAASGKGSSVSRDVLLYRVSCVLQTPDVQHWGPACNRAVRDLFPHCLAQRKGKFKKTYFFGLSLIPALEDTKGENHVHVDGTSFRPLRDMTQDLEQLLEHLPGLLYWSGEVDRGVSRDAVLHVLAARLAEGEVFHWGMQCNKALRMLFPHVLMKRKGKYKTVYFGVDFTLTAQKLLPTLKLSPEQIPPWQDQGIGVN